ncbi:MAG: nitrogen fixation protein FixP [Bdellovibrionales bacterium]|nr:nitrogen fixation protein FixP [Bdellovibrionales bacterium]
MSKKNSDAEILDVEKGKLLDHDYDGIKELNNPLPAWWTWTFILTVVFSVIYFYYYHVMSGPSLQDEYRQGMEKIQQAKQIEAKETISFTDEDFSAAGSDPTTLKLAGIAFKGQCAVCHGPEGQGGIGPNLTDNFWLNSDGSPSGIYTSIASGVLAKGMPAWKDKLSAKEVMSLTVLITKMKGTTPSNPKMPQGKEYH